MYGVSEIITSEINFTYFATNLHLFKDLSILVRSLLINISCEVAEQFSFRLNPYYRSIKILRIKTFKTSLEQSKLMIPTPIYFVPLQTTDSQKK